MDIKEAVAQVIENKDLLQAEMVEVMQQIMTGGATPAQIAGFLVALRMKGETLDEITGAVQVMRELATGVDVSGEHLVDIVGTGGDGASLFNVSTASAFVVAASGGKVVKHGNRSVSSKSGSADLLEAAGVKLSLTPAQVARCVNDVGIGFMFAPAHHSAMKYAAAPRKELGVRTLFNILGPMTNPAGVKRQLIGVFAAELCRPIAEVLSRLGSERILVVHSNDGLDEISLAADTTVAELNDGEVIDYQLKPEDFGITRQSLQGLDVTDAEDSLKLIRDALGKRKTETGNKAAEMIALNAGAAIYAAGISLTVAEGVAIAQDTVASGLALERMDELASYTDLLGTV
ncbi:MAG: anthranilate phosphoribosyltransferase [Gammaproteobacteria bacterium]|nr:MAG: anthranilate phosphoribosyltransferase [Gammaproteobacteria bacterium]RLA52494.1 MAG: anthranilate phosphoribosyltransferase [Gammaproteobacteria bacterium]